jgi:NAD(P)-dependent dehydrogenase (short-subunit alcohol dehydrogenase family)
VTWGDQRAERELVAGEIDLSRQIALVTGGGRGIGRAIAQTLVARGAAVAVAARTIADLEQTCELVAREGGRIVAFDTDVTEPGSVARLVRATEAELGPITLLVNNAGTCQAIGPTWELDPARWHREIESTLFSTFLCTRAVLPGMLDRRAGRIVNVSSWAAVGPTPHKAAYGCAKAAVLHLTNSLAAELSGSGVHVFAITPGSVLTAMTKHMSESGWLDLSSQEWLPPERGGELVAYLASGRADGLSGRFIHVLDDVETLSRRAEEIQQKDLHVLRLRT